jgi:photosystem II stability/assembly factor-like uncharacterized protein
MNDDEYDLAPLLHGRGDHLPAPAGTWESIVRRGRRRRRAKALLAGTAVVALVAGATPAVLAVMHSSDKARLQVAASRNASPAAPLSAGPMEPAVRPTLARLVPTSVSFVTQTEGWATGVLQVSGGTVAGGLARTTDGGRSWAIEIANPAPQGTVRFADSQQGYSFGTTYQETKDGGRSWHELVSPGYIADLETFHGVIWALVRSCARCDGLRLFQATLTSPKLVRVKAVKPVGSYDAALTLRGHSIFVTGGNSMWATTDDGFSWRHLHNPCGGGSQAFAAWSETGVAAECTPARGVGSLFESLDAGRHWTNIANVPAVRATVGTLSAGSPDDLLITNGTAAPFVTHHHGHSWKQADVPGAVIFAAYINNRHIVGVTGGELPAFVASEDRGTTWFETGFRGSGSVTYPTGSE